MQKMSWSSRIDEFKYSNQVMELNFLTKVCIKNCIKGTRSSLKSFDKLLSEKKKFSISYLHASLQPTYHLAISFNPHTRP